MDQIQGIWRTIPRCTVPWQFVLGAYAFLLHTEIRLLSPQENWSRLATGNMLLVAIEDVCPAAPGDMSPTATRRDVFCCRKMYFAKQLYSNHYKCAITLICHCVDMNEILPHVLSFAKSNQEELNKVCILFFAARA